MPCPGWVVFGRIAPEATSGTPSSKSGSRRAWSAKYSTCRRLVRRCHRRVQRGGAVCGDLQIPGLGQCGSAEPAGVAAAAGGVQLQAIHDWQQARMS